MKINIQYNNELNNTAGNSLRYMYMDDHNVGCELFFSPSSSASCFRGPISVLYICRKAPDEWRLNNNRPV